MIINSEEFKLHRSKLKNTLDRSGVVILSANSAVQSAGDNAFKFRQESNFWWMTGIDESDWVLVFDTENDSSILIAPKRDEVLVKFEGGLTLEDVKNISGVDDVLPWEKFDDLIDEIDSNRQIYILEKDPYFEYYHFFENPARENIERILRGKFKNISDCRKDLARCRAIKTKKEIELIQKSIDCSVEAFDFIKNNLSEYQNEFEVEAELSKIFRFSGLNSHAYDPIVASGKNACTLHYSENSQKLNEGDLLLIDAGAKLEYYPADITRTYALGGVDKVSSRAKDVHRAVQDSVNDILNLLKSGCVDIKDYSQKTDEIMKKYLIDLGLMDNMKDDNNFRKYFPHSIGHGLGVDVHESLAHEKFQPGMIMTIEPGIYIDDEGIGVRIEEDILFGEDGEIVNMSSKLSTDI